MPRPTPNEDRARSLSPHLRPHDRIEAGMFKKDLDEHKKVDVPIVVTPDVPESIRRQKNSDWHIITFSHNGKQTEGVIVDGVQRWKAVKDNPSLRKNLLYMVLESGLTEEYLAHRRLILNLARRHLSLPEKKDLAAQLLASGYSQRQVSKLTKLTRTTVGKVAQNRPPSGGSVTVSARQAARAALTMSSIEKPPSGHVSLGKASRTARNERYERLRETAVEATEDDLVTIHCPCEMSEFKDKVDAGSAGLVHADPIYQEIPEGVVIQQIVALALHALRPGGVLLLYTGTEFAYSARFQIEAIGGFQWAADLVVPRQGHNACKMHGKKKFLSMWEPVLVFAKEKYKPLLEATPTMLPMGGPQKEYHVWQKNVDETIWLLKYFSRPGDLVIDPTLGSGTTAVALLEQNKRQGGEPRRFAGCDRDPGAANLIHARLAKYRETGETV